MKDAKTRARETNCYVGAKLRQHRSQAGVSQTEMGAALGISFQQIQKYESGANRVSAASLFVIATHLRVDISDFFPSNVGDLAPIKASPASLATARAFERISDPGLRRLAHNIVKSVAAADAAHGATP